MRHVDMRGNERRMDGGKRRKEGRGAERNRVRSVEMGAEGG